MAGKSIKIKEYLEQNRNRNVYTVANEALLKIFGDEDTYLRYVLVNFNRNIDRTFGATRKDSLYVSVETALRNFSGDYKDFTECHGSYKLGYNVITSAFEDFYKLELQAFCCGVVDSKSVIAKKSYSSRYSMDYSVVNTPALITPDKNNPNYATLKAMGFDRKTMVPYLFMDAPTLAAFVQFRAMVYDKYRDNIENGFLDRSRELSHIRFPNMNKNEYVAYALAIKDTCEFFKKFYGPDRVQFTTTKLPFSLAVLNQKVNDLRNGTNITSIGTLTHFDSAKNLPMLNPERYPTHALCYAMTRMVTFGGKFVKSDSLFREGLADTKAIIAPHSDIVFDRSGISRGEIVVATPAPVEEIRQDIATSAKITEILDTNTKVIKGEITFGEEKGFAEKKSYIENTKRSVDNLRSKAYFAHYVMGAIERDVADLRSGKKNQIPMFLEYSRFGQTAFVGGIINYAESKCFNTFVTSFGKTLELLEEVSKAHQALYATGNEISKLSRAVASAEEDYHREENRTREERRSSREPDEIYVMTDYETGERVLGSYEKKEWNDTKIAYREAHTKYVSMEARVVELETEFKKSLESTTTLIRTLMFEDGIIADDLVGATDIIQELNRQFVNENYDIMGIDD